MLKTSMNWRVNEEEEEEEEEREEEEMGWLLQDGPEAQKGFA